MTVLLLSIVSCGKTNHIGGDVASGTTGLSPMTTDYSKLEGNYDLIKMRSADCGASIHIKRECNGLILISNHLGPEEFCNINRGEEKNKTVTFNGNELKSVVRFSENARLNFTSTLTLSNDGTLTKISNLKSRTSQCFYLKR